jgi:large subunit ribosomal protein L7Ae
MSKPFYVKYEAPKEVVDAAYEALNIASKSGVVRKGTNEATKAVERAIARLVVIAEDVEPPKLSLTCLCYVMKEKIRMCLCPANWKSAKPLVSMFPAASACILKEGEATGLIKEIISRLEQIKEAHSDEQTREGTGS